MRSKTLCMPKKDKWAHMLLGMLQTIEQKAAHGWGIAFVHWSRDEGGQLNLPGMAFGLGKGIVAMTRHPSQ